MKKTFFVDPFVLPSFLIFDLVQFIKMPVESRSSLKAEAVLMGGRCSAHLPAQLGDALGPYCSAPVTVCVCVSQPSLTEPLRSALVKQSRVFPDARTTSEADECTLRGPLALHFLFRVYRRRILLPSS